MELKLTENEKFYRFLIEKSPDIKKLFGDNPFKIIFEKTQKVKLEVCMGDISGGLSIDALWQIQQALERYVSENYHDYSTLPLLVVATRANNAFSESGWSHS